MLLIFLGSGQNYPHFSGGELEGKERSEIIRSKKVERDLGTPSSSSLLSLHLRPSLGTDKTWVFVLEIWLQADSPMSLPSSIKNGWFLIVGTAEFIFTCAAKPLIHFCSPCLLKKEVTLLGKVHIPYGHIFPARQKLGGYTFSHSLPGQNCICQCLEILEVFCGSFWCNILIYKS